MAALEGKREDLEIIKIPLFGEGDHWIWCMQEHGRQHQD